MYLKSVQCSLEVFENCTEILYKTVIMFNWFIELGNLKQKKFRASTVNINN